MLLDEPFVSLDDPSADRLRQTLMAVWSERPTTVLFVTHNLEDAIQLGDRIALMHEGRLEQVDTAQNLMRHPATERVADYFRVRPSYGVPFQ